MERSHVDAEDNRNTLPMGNSIETPASVANLPPSQFRDFPASLSRQHGWRCEAIDHIHFYVDNVSRWGQYFETYWGFRWLG